MCIVYTYSASAVVLLHSPNHGSKASNSYRVLQKSDYRNLQVFWGQLLPQCVFPAEAEKMREPAPEISSQQLRFASNATYRELCGPVRAIWCDLHFNFFFWGVGIGGWSFPESSPFLLDRTFQHFLTVQVQQPRGWDSSKYEDRLFLGYLQCESSSQPGHTHQWGV